MKAQILYENEGNQWVVLGRDPAKPNYVIDTNEYMIVSKGNTMLLDPGGTEIFPDVVSAVSRHVPLESITAIFGSHQDPDILSSLALWLGVCPKAHVYVPWTWTSFITHFGCDPERMHAIPDEGMSIELSPGYRLDFVPAHYLHSSGNNHVYDPQSKLYFSGDIGAALLPPEEQDSMFVKDFNTHTRYMEKFHRRWMPSNRARDVWVDRVSKLDIELMCPQHGSIFRRADVPKFLQWLGGLELGCAVAA